MNATTDSPRPSTAGSTVRVALLRVGHVGGRDSYTRNLGRELARRDDVDPVDVSTTADADFRLPLLSGSEIEFLCWLWLATLLGRLPSVHVVHCQRSVEAVALRLGGYDGAIVGTCHGRIGDELEGEQPRIARAYQQVERIAFRRCLDHLIAVDETTEAYVRERVSPDELPVTVVPTGIDPTVFRDYSADDGSAKTGDRDDDPDADADLPTLLFAARLDEVKDVPLLVETFAELRTRRDARLVVAGDGPKREALERGLAERGLGDDLTCHGFVEHDRLAALMNEADCLLLTSKFEGSPTVVREALACGLPVVTPDVGDVRSLLDDSGAGVVTDDRTAPALADAVETVLDDYAAFRDRARAAPVASFDDVAERTTAVYRAVL